MTLQEEALVERDYITVEEAARMTGKQTRTVRSWYRKGWLTRYTVGTGWVRLDRAEVEKLMSVTPSPVVTGAER